MVLEHLPIVGHVQVQKVDAEGEGQVHCRNHPVYQPVLDEELDVHDGQDHREEADAEAPKVTRLPISIQYSRAEHFLRDKEGDESFVKASYGPPHEDQLVEGDVPLAWEIQVRNVFSQVRWVVSLEFQQRVFRLRIVGAGVKICVDAGVEWDRPCCELQVEHCQEKVRKYSL